MEKKQDNKGPSLAPGIDGAEGINEDAAKKDRQKGDTTNVTRLFLDETEPS
ncbi:hypothetical protein [Bacillus sp. T33-2]|uniref:hypothetical protein n=1 Tax=Bacillus sp. T33-2 TaxID=2054168 RepID=UPI0015E09809|nr:hypothetical protein [Bacillus sp. T33-2]